MAVSAPPARRPEQRRRRKRLERRRRPTLPSSNGATSSLQGGMPKITTKMTETTKSASLRRLALVVAAAAAALPPSEAAPNSKPYVAYRTHPFDEDKAKRYEVGKRAGGPDVGMPRSRSKVNKPRRVEAGSESQAVGIDGGGGGGDPRCPLSFRIGLSTSGPSAGGGGAEGGAKSGGGRNAIRSPPVIHPIHPGSGPGRQVLYSTVWERLDMLNPIPPGVAEEATRRSGGPLSFEGMTADAQFPLLLESANLYYAQPIVHDTNGDGVPEAILVDYDGLVILAGLDYDPVPADASASERRGKRTRHYHTAQIPRLYVRKNWVECATNKSKEEEMSDWDPYHSYFEYGVEWNEEYDSKRLGKVISGNVVEQELEDAKELEKVKRSRKERAKERAEEAEEEKAREEAERRKEEEAKEEEDGEAKAEEDGKVKVEEGEAKEEGEAGKQDGGKQGEAEAAQKKERTQKGKEDKQDAVAREDKAEGGGDGAQVEGENKGADAGPDRAEGGGDGAGAQVKAENKGADAAAGEKRADAKADDEKEGKEKEGTVAGRRRLQEEEAPPDLEAEADPAGGDAELESEDKDEDEEEQYGENWEGTRSGDEDEENPLDDDEYERYRRERDPDYMDDEYPPPEDYYDDYYGSRYDRHNDFYSDSNYIRVPPHVLSRPALVEIPKRYKVEGDDEQAKEEFLAVAVSYYFDEDEFAGVQSSYRRFRNTDGGDETPTQRGSYVASALMFYNVADKRWETQEHLDLSTDFTSPANFSVGDAEIHTDGHNGMIALAAASPTIAFWGGRHRAVVGTSMGLLHALDVPTAYTADGFPVQFEHPIVRRALAEDLVPDEGGALDIVALDEGGNVVCLKGEDASTLWHRDLLAGGEREEGAVITATSEMSLGDVDGDGTVDVVLAVRVANAASFTEEVRLYALDGATGDDVPRFPIALDAASEEDDDGGKEGGAPHGGTAAAGELVQPLLVDLHASQSHWADRLRLNDTFHSERENIRKLARSTNERAAAGTIAPLRPLHGGMALGLHVVQPLGSDLHVVEGGTGCAQRVGVGERVGAMVQADDVHGTGTLDLVVTTSSGRVLTLEVPDAVPYHPLNVWGSGAARGGTTSGQNAHGYSASAGAFVHPRSRSYRDWLGLYVPVTFEIFDRSPPTASPDREREYLVEFRAGTSHKRAIWRKTYHAAGIYTEQIFVPHGPGYYALTLRMTTKGGLSFEDTFHVGYNVNYTAGLAWLVLVPLVAAAVPLLLYRRTPNWEEDEDYGGSGGILGRTVQD